MPYFLTAIWICGIAILWAIQIRLTNRLLESLAPGVQLRDVVPFKRRASTVDPALFGTEGKRYRLILIRNETIYFLWIFVVGPILYFLPHATEK